MATQTPSFKIVRDKHGLGTERSAELMKTWIEEICRVFVCPECTKPNLLPGYKFCPMCGMKVQWRISGHWDQTDLAAEQQDEEKLDSVESLLVTDEGDVLATETEDEIIIHEDEDEDDDLDALIDSL